MKANVLVCLRRIEALIYRRETFAALSWLAVALALVAMFGGSRWAFASCALSLSLLAHMSIVLFSNAASLASSFKAISEMYRREVDGTAKKQSEVAQVVN
jgi:hypothetical protein